MMSRRPSLIVTLVLGLMLALGLALHLSIAADEAPMVTSSASSRAVAGLLATNSGAAREGTFTGGGARDADATEKELLRPVFDLLRIDPSGQSVFAGRSEPGADIVVLAGEQEVARTRAASDGTWSIVTGSIYSGGQVPFRAAATKAGRTTTGEPVEMAVPVTPQRDAAPVRVANAPAAKASKSENRPAQKLASAETARTSDALRQTARPQSPATRELERLVDQVRKNPDASSNPERAPGIIPLPVLFETGQSTFSNEGRRAAGLLAEYLKGAGLKSITLSGHADERGSDTYNLWLSRRRLDAIAGYLRAEGYSGELTLVAKGESEPFTGIDRRAAPRQELWRADRRVELRTR